MNAGRPIAEVATEIRRQRQTRRDFKGSQGMMALVSNRNEDGTTKGIGIAGLAEGLQFPINPFCHGQIASDLAIPKVYYDRMLKDQPDLVVANANAWLSAQPERKRMVRTLDGNARAWLSDKYRPLDNADLIAAVLPTLHAIDAVVQSVEITDRRLYLKATLPSLRMEVRGSKRVGDIVEAGICISNSEIGEGSVRVDPYVLFLASLNGMKREDSKIRKYHIGKGADAEGVRELLSNQARDADDRAFWLKVRDVTRASFDQPQFARFVETLESTTQQPILSNKLEAVCELAAKKMGFDEGIADQMLRNLIEGADLSRFGMSQAITAIANTHEDYEMSTALESAGAAIIEMPARDWWSISNAAMAL